MYILQSCVSNLPCCKSNYIRLQLRGNIFVLLSVKKKFRPGDPTAGAYDGITVPLVEYIGKHTWAVSASQFGASGN